MNTIQGLGLVLGLLFLLDNTLAIMFNLNPNTQKCLKDEMQPKELIMGEVSSVGGKPRPGNKTNFHF